MRRFAAIFLFLSGALVARPAGAQDDHFDLPALGDGWQPRSYHVLTNLAAEGVPAEYAVPLSPVF